MKIAGYDVEVITHESAKVGCTNVTRAEAEALLAEMNKIPTSPFLQPGPESPQYVSFSLVHKGTGWLAASEKIKNARKNDYAVYGFGNYHSVSLCLSNRQAEDLLKFLTDQLGYVAYKLSETLSCITPAKQQKWAIEYSVDGQNQGRTGNKGATEEFTSYAQAQAIAEHEEREMGTRYRYWVVEVQ